MDHWFDAEMDRAEDTDFWIRLLLAGCAMAWMPAIISEYRTHPDNSPGSLERYYRGYLRLLDRVFRRNDLPSVVRSEEPALYAHYHLLGACYAYAAGEMESGQERLRQAAALAPESLDGDPPPLAATLAGVAQGAAVANPAALVETMFDKLPAELARLRPYRRYALSALHMRRVFHAHVVGAQPRMQDWLAGVFRHPGWLANRGVWSILLRDVVLRSPAMPMKH
jgi:hypothetical protein